VAPTVTLLASTAAGRGPACVRTIAKANSNVHNAIAKTTDRFIQIDRIQFLLVNPAWPDLAIFKS